MKRCIVLMLVLIPLVLAIEDKDIDGVPDNEDMCPDSKTIYVDASGCSCEQKECKGVCKVVKGNPVCIAEKEEVYTEEEIFVEEVRLSDENDETLLVYGILFLILSGIFLAFYKKKRRRRKRVKKISGQAKAEPGIYAGWYMEYPQMGQLERYKEEQKRRILERQEILRKLEKRKIVLAHEYEKIRRKTLHLKPKLKKGQVLSDKLKDMANKGSIKRLRDMKK